MAIIEIENGSVTSALGFQAAGITAGLKRSGSADMALLFSEVPAVTAGAFTANKFAAPPVQLCREWLFENEKFRAVIINSGNANACTGKEGYADALQMAEKTAACLHVSDKEVLVSSTGRIGVPMPMQKILSGIESAVAALSAENGQLAARAIMTTDTVPKSYAVELEIDGKMVRIGGMAKGAGMIAPKLLMVGPKNQATMLAYVTTDAAVQPAFLRKILAKSLNNSFNRITIDGDTSTNDTLLVMANGLAGNQELNEGHPAAMEFAAALEQVLGRLARELVWDGEGVTRFVELCVTGALNDAEAKMCAEAIANSALCKTAWFGADPNWGRILDAAGYSGAEIAVDKVSLNYSGIPIVRNGKDAGTPESQQTEAINKREFRIELDLGVAAGSFTIWTCDLTYEYVKINADYHT